MAGIGADLTIMLLYLVVAAGVLYGLIEFRKKYSDNTGAQVGLYVGIIAVFILFHIFMLR